MNVLVCDPISAEGIAALQQCQGLNVIVLEKRPTESELISMVSDVNAIIVRSETKITRNVITAAPSLKVVGRAGVGVD
ncbi:MAG: phosphoglycerate dehydrogenase, partial [Verrucomicrobia bacterium]|nr:phosphoglycerate dehydrogenase [Verrucomicrobiota bacterium]